jgi:hypothetical protein
MRHLVFRDRVYRTGKLAGQIETYWPDPAFGVQKHHKKNAIFVGSEAAAVSLVRRFGFHLRMRGYLTGQRNLISPEEIKDLPNA